MNIKIVLMKKKMLMILKKSKQRNFYIKCFIKINYRRIYRKYC